MNPKQINKTISKNCLIDPDSIVVDLSLSQGSYLVDARDGKSYLDCFSQFASQSIGWNHPKVIAQKNRLANAALHKIANPDMTSEEYALFVKQLSKKVPHHPHLFFIDGGALAVENALKAAFDWKMQKLGWENDKAANQLNVIYLREAFHGRSGYTLSLTNNDNVYNPKVWGFPKFDWSKITNPKCWHGIDGISERKAAGIENISVQEIESVLKNKNRPVAAMIMEPIQGEGGDNHFRKEYFQAVRTLADEHEFLLIFDEVQTGFGLTGKFWAFQHFKVEPDIICFGKKSQVCGIAANKRLDEVDSVFKVSSRINSTWGGNLVDMTRSSIQLEIIDEDCLVDNAAEVGEYFLTQLRSLYSINKNVSNIRGRGLMLAFDLDSPEERDSVLFQLNKNLLALPCGKKSIRFRPHLTFTKSDVDVAMEHIKSSIKR